VDARFDKMDVRIDGICQDLSELKLSLSSMKVWAISLYAALASSMFLVMARGFEWI
jgi:hypothetical protein